MDVGRRVDSKLDANELLLLGLLDRQEMHGYRLHEFLEHQLSFVSDLKRPTAYRLLEQLLRQRLVERSTEREGRRPERMVYRITPEGRTRFETLLREQLASAERVVYPGNVALLFSDRLSREERLDMLEKRLAGVQVQRDALVEVVDAHIPGTAPWLALEHDLAHLDAELAWLKAALDRLQSTVADPAASTVRCAGDSIADCRADAWK